MQAFMEVYKTLSDEIIADEVADNQVRPAAAVHTRRSPRSRALLVPQTTNAVAWMREMMDYNVPLGKLNRGLAVLDGECLPPTAKHDQPCRHRI